MAYVDLGNAPKFELTPKVETLPHWSHRLGTRTKDDEIVVQKELDLAITLDEFNQFNLALMTLGSQDGATQNILDLSNFKGSVQLNGTNAVGTQLIVTLPNVLLAPNGKIDLIGNEWGELEVQCKVFGDPITGSFGTIVPVLGAWTAAPNILNYFIGKGIVSFQINSES